MRQRLTTGIISLFYLLLLTAHLPSTAQAVDGDGHGNGDGKTVFVLPLNGAIDKSLMIVFRRAFQEAGRMQPAAIVLDIDTPGGGLLETEEIIAWMRSVQVPIYAYVNPHALSAGAIISLGSDAIYMAPGSRIGSAFPIIMAPGGGGVIDLPPKVYEKILSDTRALVRGLAQENGYDEDVVLAMVDPDRELSIGEDIISAPGELLNLTAREAIEVIPPRQTPLLARAIVSDIESLLEHAGLGAATTVYFEIQPAERLARWIVMIGPVLFSLGLLGIFIELKTPGFGLPGIAGIILLGVYFFGHYVAGLAGMEDITLVVIGFILLAVEIFVIPGFGITGALGLLLILTGTVLGMIPYLPSGPAEWPGIKAPDLFDYLNDALLRMVLIGGISGVGIYLLGKLLPRTSLYRRLVLGTELTRDAGYVSSNVRYKEHLGEIGVAVTFLRPAGIGMFGDTRLDVVSSGELIEKGRKIKIIAVQGSRIVVETMAE